MNNRNLILYIFLSIFSVQQISQALCLRIHIPENIFKVYLHKVMNRVEIQKRIDWGNSIYVDKFYKGAQGHLKFYRPQEDDIRVTRIPPNVLLEYINRENNTVREIPEDVLKKYSPYSIIIEYLNSKGKKKLIEQPIIEPGVIEVCYLIGGKIAKGRGIINKIKEKLNKKKLGELTVSLRVKKDEYGIEGDMDLVILCRKFKELDAKALEINIDLKESKYIPDIKICSVTPIK